jgi:glycerol-3-phosphate dehydrogenase
VVARDRETNSEISFRTKVVINAGGPWSQEVGEQFGSHHDNWFWPSLAWNLLTNKPALSEYALAITPPRDGGRTYFLHPWKGRLFAGTGHSAWKGPVDNPRPSSAQTRQMIDDLNSAIPGLELGKENISRVVAGLLSAIQPGSPKIATKPAIVNHSESGGPDGLISICGVKFTTARLVAEKTLDSVFGPIKAVPDSGFQRPQPGPPWESGSVDFSDEKEEASYGRALSKLVADESAMNLCDVVFRRTDLWERPQLALRLAPRISEFFDWSESRSALELRRLEQELAQPESRHGIARET